MKVSYLKKYIIKFWYSGKHMKWELKVDDVVINVTLHRQTLEVQSWTWHDI